MSDLKDNLKVCVLAGGLSTRLYPVTRTVPKPMVPIGDRPFLQLLLEHFAGLGYRRFVLAVSYLWEQIRDYFGDGSAFGWEIEYSVEPEPLGTGGAVKYAQCFLGDRAIIANGDTFLPEDWRKFAAAALTSGLPAAMALVKQDDCRRFGTVAVNDGKVAGFIEKNSAAGAGWINAGVYMISSSLLDKYNRGQKFSLERELFPAIGGRIAAYMCQCSFDDIGTPESLEEFRQKAATVEAKEI